MDSVSGDRSVEQLKSLLSAGRYREAETVARDLIKTSPRSESGWQGLAVALGAQARYAELVPLLNQMLAMWPSNAETSRNMAYSLRALRRNEEAVDFYLKALNAAPESAALHSALADTLRELGRRAEAETHYRRELVIEPHLFPVLGNLGNVLLKLRRLPEAADCMRRAIALRPDAAQGHTGLGSVLTELNQFDDAGESFRRALALHPESHEALNGLGNVLHELGHYAESLPYYQRALQLKPDFHHAHNNLGSALQALAHYEEARACYQKALSLEPDYAEAHNNLGRVLLVLGRPREAERSCARALELSPSYEKAQSNLGNIRLHIGDLAGAEKHMRRALEIRPDLHYTHSNLLFALSHDEEMDSVALAEEHRAFGQKFESPLRHAWPAHRNSRDPERRLQVGLVSGDLRDHAVAHFVEPVVHALAESPSLRLHAYSNHPVEDRVTARLKPAFAHWNNVSGMSDEDLANRVAADRIDILIDLSGHTGGHRLLTFARKPAPLQASWIGYPGTTGLAAMDYFLADRHYLPRDLFDQQFSEKIVHLPVYAAFRPVEDAPPISALPALSGHGFTFGSFNRQSKINANVIRHWAMLLKATSGSRMLLAGLPADESIGILTEGFAREGISADRLTFHPQRPMARYLELHSQVDLCLDTFGYTGGTTTLHALWMGVPTLSLAGRSPARRLGSTINRHLALDGLVASDHQDFVRKGMQWASDLKALSELRMGMRERFRRSPIGRADLVAGGLENALRRAWRRWCDGMPPQGFSVD